MSRHHCAKKDIPAKIRLARIPQFDEWETLSEASEFSNKKDSHCSLQRRSPGQLHPEISYYILVGQAWPPALESASLPNGHL